MQVSVENISHIKRKLTITVPAEQWDNAYQARMQKMKQEAQIKGFRRGNVPVHVLEQNYGKEIRQEALSEVIKTALSQAIVENKLMPVSTPQVEPKTILANQPLEFIATFDVLPEIENIEFKLDQVNKLKVDIIDADIDQVLKQIVKQYTQWKVVSRAAKETDRVVIDYQMMTKDEAKKEDKIENFPLELGSKMMLPGFEDSLIGKSAGDEVNIQLTFPADFHVEDKRNQPVEFVVKVKQIYEAEVPEMNEGFIKRLGIASGQLEDIKTQIRDSLTLERDRLVNENLKQQVFGQLLESNTVEVPQSMIDREAAIIHNELHPHHQQDGHHHHTEEENAMFTQIAQKRVALGLLIAAYAKKADLKADAELVKKRILEIASVYESPKEVVEYLSTNHERRSGIEAQVLEDLVLAKLLENVATTEVVKSYAELKGISV